MKILKTFLIIFFLTNIPISCDALTFIRDLLSYYGAGPSVIHKTLNTPFDPEAGIRRSIDYRRLNGLHGSKYVERLGLGNDGKQLERLTQQKIRDDYLYDLIRKSSNQSNDGKLSTYNFTMESSHSDYLSYGKS